MLKTIAKIDMSTYYKIEITVDDKGGKDAILDALGRIERGSEEKPFKIGVIRETFDPEKGLGRMQKNMLNFVRKNKGWRSICPDKQTISVAKSLERRGLIKFAILEDMIKLA